MVWLVRINSESSIVCGPKAESFSLSHPDDATPPSAILTNAGNQQARCGFPATAKHVELEAAAPAVIDWYTVYLID